MRKIDFRNGKNRRNIFGAVMLLMLMLLGVRFLFTSVDWSAGAALFIAGVTILDDADSDAPQLE
jgi:membrane-bound ClpP family serine protease